MPPFPSISEHWAYCNRSDCLLCLPNLRREYEEKHGRPFRHHLLEQETEYERSIAPPESEVQSHTRLSPNSNPQGPQGPQGPTSAISNAEAAMKTDPVLGPSEANLNGQKVALPPGSVNSASQRNPPTAIPNAPCTIAESRVQKIISTPSAYQLPSSSADKPPHQTARPCEEQAFRLHSTPSYVGSSSQPPNILLGLSGILPYDWSIQSRPRKS